MQLAKQQTCVRPTAPQNRNPEELDLALVPPYQERVDPRTSEAAGLAVYQLHPLRRGEVQQPFVCCLSRRLSVVSWPE